MATRPRRTPQTPLWHLGSVVHALRTAQAWTLSDLAERCGIKTLATLSDLESGRQRQPQPETVAVIATAFGHTTASLTRLIPVTRTLPVAMRQVMRTLDALSPEDREEMLAMFHSLLAVKRLQPGVGVTTSLKAATSIKAGSRVFPPALIIRR